MVGWRRTSTHLVSHMYTNFFAPAASDPRRIDRPVRTSGGLSRPTPGLDPLTLVGTKTQIASALGILDLPVQIEDLADPWVVVASQLIWLGAAEINTMDVKPGINLDHALGHLRAIAQAVKLPYERREAAVAHLLSQWFVRIEMKDGTAAAHASA